MKRVFGLSRLGLAGVALVAACLAAPSIAQAANIYLCVSTTAGATVTSGGTTSGKCGTNKEVQLPEGKSEQETLINILPNIKYVASGIDSKPTIRFEKVNVQVVDGEGKTATTNGEGNLVIGYDEEPGTQTGSHNLILGGIQAYTSYGGILAGLDNEISGPFASVTGGATNVASALNASVSGGNANVASGEEASVSGGDANTASGLDASVSGGSFNKSKAAMSSVSGGINNTAGTEGASVSGGDANTATGLDASVSGGKGNKAEAAYSVIGGGNENTTKGELSYIAGGMTNVTSDLGSAVMGGCANLAGAGTSPAITCNETESFQTILGGVANHPTGTYSSISGGKLNKTTGYGANVSGGLENTAKGKLSSILGAHLQETTSEFQIIP